MGVAFSDDATVSRVDDCKGLEPPGERREHMRCPGLQIADETVIVAVGHVVEILHAEMSVIFCASANCVGTNVAEAEVANQALLFEFGKDSRGSSMEPSDGAAIPPTPRLTTSSASSVEVAEIVMNGI